MDKTGVLVETDNETIKASVHGVISCLKTQGLPVWAFVVCEEPGQFTQALSRQGADCIVEIRIRSEEARMNPRVLSEAAAQAVKQTGVRALFGPATPGGKELLARVASRFEAPLVTDCTGVDLESGTAYATRYSGKTDALIGFEGKYALFGMRPNYFDAVPCETTPETIVFEPEIPGETGIRFDGIVESAAEGIDLTEADIIISGGRGMKNGNNFSVLFECARELNAAVGASRVAVDEGWVPYTMQVGQTGVKVNPKVYIACGISGSVQHFAGMKTAGTIIAINTDENAPIISKSDYYTTGDLFETVRELTRRLKITSK